mmetsp:Transcript_5802/g.14091  ORF Transcript_5802/g.14091 Transcript_5802/m.14091 type:complete len:350 (+) Transcript_5802:363-1412(+)
MLFFLLSFSLEPAVSLSRCSEVSLPLSVLVYPKQCELSQVHKSGGTTIRDWVKDKQSRQWNVLSFQSGLAEDPFCVGQKCVKTLDQLVSLASTDPAEFERVHGRAFLEDHGGVHDIRRSLRAVRRLRGDSPFAKFGCRALTFTVLREPKSYLVSMALSHYKYSPFMDVLLRRHGKVHIDDPTWRYGLMQTPEYLDNMLTRQLGMWCSSDPLLYPAYGFSNETDEWYRQPVDAGTVRRVLSLVRTCFDVVGLTNRIPELLLLLSDLAGFQHVKEEPSNMHLGLLHSFSQKPWYNEEMEMLSRVSRMSHHDARIYKLAERKFERMAKKIEDSERRLKAVTCQRSDGSSTGG